MLGHRDRLLHPPERAVPGDQLRPARTRMPPTHDGRARRRAQPCGQVRNAYTRVVNDSDGAELARYDLSEDASS